MSTSDNQVQNEQHQLHEAASKLRASLRTSYPEIDALYSDEYISAVLSVPNRSYEYARDMKIRGALEWRRCDNIDALVAAFDYDESRGLCCITALFAREAS